MKYLNPVFKKELKQAAHMKRTGILIFFYNAALALFGLFAFYVTFHLEGNYHSGANYADILTIYAIITGIEFALVLFLIPPLTAGSITGEREKQTLDILLTTSLTPGKIVTGKLLSSISMVILLAFSSLPVVSVIFSVGGITLWDLARFMLLITATAIYIGSIGIFFSSLCKRTAGSVICTYLVMLLLMAGTSAFILGAVAVYNVKEFGEAHYLNLVWYQSGIGKFVYLLFLNPFISYISMLKDQIGYFEGLMNGIAVSGELGNFAYRNWFLISIGMQIVCSVFLLTLASIKLDPHSFLKSKKKRG